MATGYGTLYGHRQRKRHGAARAIPGQRTFKGAPARANAQAESSRLIADLPLDPKELMRQEIATAWKAGKTPQEV